MTVEKIVQQIHLPNFSHLLIADTRTVSWQCTRCARMGVEAQLIYDPKRNYRTQVDHDLQPETKLRMYTFLEWQRSSIPAKRRAREPGRNNDKRLRLSRIYIIVPVSKSFASRDNGFPLRFAHCETQFATMLISSSPFLLFITAFITRATIKKKKKTRRHRSNRNLVS